MARWSANPSLVLRSLFRTLDVSSLWLTFRHLNFQPSQKMELRDGGLSGVTEAELGPKYHWDAQEPRECDCEWPWPGAGLVLQALSRGLRRERAICVLPGGEQEQRGLTPWSCLVTWLRADCLPGPLCGVTRLTRYDFTKAYSFLSYQKCFPLCIGQL